MQFVKYIGTAHRRGITVEDWKRAGFPNQDAVWWGAENGWAVSADQFSDDIMNKVIKPDRGLVVINTDEEIQPATEGHTPQTWADVRRPVITDQHRAEMAGAVSGDGGPPPSGESGSAGTPAPSPNPSGHGVRGSVGGSTATTG